MRSWILAVGIFVGMLILISQARAQNDQMFIYGEVTTIDGDKYEGPIRWGGNEGSDEVYWVEMFNAIKTSNDFMKFLSKSEIEALPKPERSSWLGLDISSLNIWEDRYSRSYHQFDTQFGDIKTVKPTGKNRAKITLKNGVILEVSGEGHEDVGSTIRVYDQELGEVSIKWSRIEEVNFRQGPSSLKYKYGEPVYAKVNAGRRGTFSGIIQWGGHERFGRETIDGKDRNGDRAIPFRSIARIERGRNGSDVTLKSGRSFYLRGTNDVDEDNSNVIVYNPEIGKVTIPWEDFIDMETMDPPGFKIAYDDFEVSQGLTATVKTIRGDEYKGLIAFDLDEGWEFELLDGKDDDAVYEIPFRNIKSIIPKNYDYSTVILKNGTDLLLGDERDVSEDNDGVLIFTTNSSGKTDPVYIRWSRIDEIIFD